MIVGILGLLDIHTAILLCAIGLEVEVPLVIIFITAVLVFAKACISIMNVGGLQDVGIAILLLLSIIIHVPQEILFVAAAIGGFKGISSLAAF